MKVLLFVLMLAAIGIADGDGLTLGLVDAGYEEQNQPVPDASAESNAPHPAYFSAEVADADQQKPPVDHKRKHSHRTGHHTPNQNADVSMNINVGGFSFSETVKSRAEGSTVGFGVAATNDAQVAQNQDSMNTTEIMAVNISTPTVDNITQPQPPVYNSIPAGYPYNVTNASINGAPTVNISLP